MFCQEHVTPTVTTRWIQVNTQDYGSPGEHWLAIFVEESHVEVFDSFGQPPTYYGLRFNVPCFFNDRPLQDRNSTSCGLFALFFLFWRSRDINMDIICDTFDSDVNRNEREMELFSRMLSG